MVGHDTQCVRRQVVQRIATCHKVNTGRHHGSGVNEGRYRRRAGHGIGQPGVERYLCAFAHRAHKEQQAYRGHDGRIGIGGFNPGKNFCSR
jgi:hypothetical protein